MKKVIIGLVVALASWSVLAGEGVITVASTHSAKDTADNFVAITQEKGLNVFARINHQENAAKVDMTLRPTEVIVFGNPKVGTPLMLCMQEVALDLPQKVLVYEDAEGKTWLAYNDPMYLKQRYHIEGCDEVLRKISGVLGSLTSAAAK
ncbi:DUF302 domain-containing protein [Vibrio parahaemolyticus]|uniref:DUF302 domain-containing protein n=1 Tax=Vibrio parahaemolyticus TaxID=670 RepID=UPI001DAFF445|nr:DUF302 domain-containing protein [Vibrio parahaemolyticus]EGR3132521.1 DUF302 domain-containing protein [Vibrio parahaemolyticus]EGR3155701.1 DUF302 domain-containing protein [Vibrio parahaemolyticus]EHY8864383.1 DUF302 domain-containing protein [Vibrio parahaemolyticus]EII3128580.1 DUF302 domain-containing protein [Vibrio parahaemolyticus]EJG1503923.1 DUF302 domain-containing protein [Vibrio parahaemolyticus]